MEKETKEFKHVVRVMNTDLEGKKQIAVALRGIKGIGLQFANAICYSSNIDKEKLAGNLNEDEIARIEGVIKNPKKFDIPEWVFNRRRDLETGETSHLVLTDLNLTHENDIKRLKKIRCYRGVRHSYGQPCRGQRTKAHFRKNKGKVMGVKKKAGIKRGRV